MRGRQLQSLKTQFSCVEPCATQQGVFISSLNWSFDVANRAPIADRTIVLAAIAVSRASAGQIALSTLILGVSLVLLSGAEWMHAT